MTRCCVYLALLLILMAGSATAQQHLLDSLEGRPFTEETTKLALVVWVQGYTHLSVVENAENDGNRIEQELSKLGFRLLRTVRNASAPSDVMDRVNEVKAQIAASAGPVMVVFYFAGHGFQIEGENYLVTRLASNASTAELLAGSVPVKEITRKLTPSRRAGTLLMMLDACRTVRFADGAHKDFPIRDDLEPGFREGTFIASALINTSAASDQAARSQSSFGGNNSPYTRAVAPLLSSNLSLTEVLEKTQKKVLLDTEVQRPTWIPATWSSTFFFTPSKEAENSDLEAWANVTRNVENIRSCSLNYLLTHPTGKFATRAEYLFTLANGPPTECSLPQER
jgi:hypothetical protein